MIIEKGKECEMLIATKQGLVSQVAQMINDAIYSFKNKGLKVRSGNKDVRYWLSKSSAKVSSYPPDVIEVVLGLACSPAEIKGRIKLTKKEAEIVSKLQNIWDNNIKYCYFHDIQKYQELAEQLRALTHHLACYREFTYYYGMEIFYQKENLLAKAYNLSGLCDEPCNYVSTEDLVPLRELFRKN
jgi:hypothetical protein